MTKRSFTTLILLVICSGISLVWGFLLERSARGVMVDYKIVYYGARCLIQHCDPYNEADLMRVYVADGGERPTAAAKGYRTLQVVASQTYFPSASIYLAPFALMPWGTAYLLWKSLTFATVTFAAFLMWTLGEKNSADLSFYLICIVLTNSGVLFAGGNPAGLAVGLCVLAVWCFVRERFVYAGILCLSISLAIKPHDAGLVWLYFLLAGGVYRKRAFQTLVLTCMLAIPATIWVSHIAPHWMQELHSNLLTYSVPGAFNDPGPSSNSGISAGMIVDLQTIVSVFRDEPGFYNPIAYLICAPLLLVWGILTLRSRPSREKTYIALAAIATITMLPIYHRPYDAKLLLLTIPACAMLWAEGGRVKWPALAFTAAGISITSDLPLGLLARLTGDLHLHSTELQGKLLLVCLTRPIPLVLFASSVFYLWVYVRRFSTGEQASTHPVTLLRLEGEAAPT